MYTLLHTSIQKLRIKIIVFNPTGLQTDEILALNITKTHKTKQNSYVLTANNAKQLCYDIVQCEYLSRLKSDPMHIVCCCSIHTVADKTLYRVLKTLLHIMEKVFLYHTLLKTAVFKADIEMLKFRFTPWSEMFITMIFFFLDRIKSYDYTFWFRKSVVIGIVLIIYSAFINNS